MAIERYYSTREVRKMLGVTGKTIRSWIKEGKIKAVNIHGRWYIPESEIRRLIGKQ